MKIDGWIVFIAICVFISVFIGIHPISRTKAVMTSYFSVYDGYRDSCEDIVLVSVKSLEDSFMIQFFLIYPDPSKRGGLVTYKIDKATFNVIETSYRCLSENKWVE